HVLGVGCEHNVDVEAADQFQVGVQAARIVFKIFGLIKLQRVDENRGQHQIIFGARLFKERTVSIVQCSHGRDQANLGVRIPGGRQFSNVFGDQGFDVCGGGCQEGLLVSHVR